jgi:putative acetyltransferase
MTLPDNVRIRAETPDDAEEIDLVELAAFEDPQIPPLIAAIRASSGWIPDLALVAERSGSLIGHIVVSRTTLEADDGTTVPILMLSPLGVLPVEQSRAVGSALIGAALDLADQRPEPLMIVQGHPDYYPRFGFVRGRTIGIVPPEHLGAIDRAWMARRRPGSDSALAGRVVYPPAFLALDS